MNSDQVMEKIERLTRASYWSGSAHHKAAYTQHRKQKQVVENLLSEIRRDIDGFCNFKRAPNSVPASEKLWCIHVQGPDDQIAVRNKADGLEEANKLNALFSKSAYSNGDPLMRAVVIEWPHSAEKHADCLSPAEAPHLCVEPACGPTCCGCANAMPPQDMRTNAVRYALLQRMDPRFGMPAEWLSFKTLDEAVDSELAKLEKAKQEQVFSA